MSAFIRRVIVLVGVASFMAGQGSAAGRPAAADREGVRPFTGAAPKVDRPGSWMSYDLDLSQESVYIRLPKGYQPQRPAGLIVFINAGDTMGVPDDWKRELDRRYLIYAAPQRVGNAQDNRRRGGLAVLTLLKMIEQYKVDPKRVFLTGFSGGARVASMVAFWHPELVRGVFPICGLEYPGAVPRVKATQDYPGFGTWTADPAQTDQARKTVKFAPVTGPKDFRYGNIQDIVAGGFTPQGFQIRLFDVPKMGHQVCDGKTLAAVLDWLEGAADSARPLSSRRP